MLTKKMNFLSKNHVISLPKKILQKILPLQPKSFQISQKKNHLESQKKTFDCCHYGLNIIFSVKSLKKNVDKKL